MGRDRHGLHEPQPVGPRRPGVRVHPVAAAAAAERWSSATGRTRGRARRLGWWTRAAAGWHEAQRLRIARFGDNMREVAVTEGDKVEAQVRLGFSVNGYGVGELVAAVDAVADAEVDDLVSEYERTYAVRRAAAPTAATGTPSCATRRASRAACARSSRTAASARSPTRSRTSARCEQLPGIAVQRLMADGYGFGAEGDWKAAALVRILKVMGEGLPGGTSFMEDYTYHLGDRCPRCSARTCSRSARRSPAARPSCEIHPLSIGGRADPVRLVFDAAPGPAVVAGPGRPRRPLPADRQRGRRRRARRAAAAAARRPRGVAAAARPGDRGGGVAHRRRPAPHGADARRCRSSRSRTSPRSPASSSFDRRRDDRRRVPARAALEPGVLPPSRAGSDRGDRTPGASPRRSSHRVARTARCRPLGARRRSRRRRVLGRSPARSIARGRSRTAMPSYRRPERCTTSGSRPTLPPTATARSG